MSGPEIVEEPPFLRTCVNALFGPHAPRLRTMLECLEVNPARSEPLRECVAELYRDRLDALLDEMAPRIQSTEPPRMVPVAQEIWDWTKRMVPLAKRDERPLPAAGLIQRLEKTPMGPAGLRVRQKVLASFFEGTLRHRMEGAEDWALWPPRAAALVAAQIVDAVRPRENPVAVARLERALRAVVAADDKERAFVAAAAALAEELGQPHLTLKYQKLVLAGLRRQHTNSLDALYALDPPRAFGGLVLHAASGGRRLTREERTAIRGAALAGGPEAASVPATWHYLVSVGHDEPWAHLAFRGERVLDGGGLLAIVPGYCGITPHGDCKQRYVRLLNQKIALVDLTWIPSTRRARAEILVEFRVPPLLEEPDDAAAAGDDAETIPDISVRDEREAAAAAGPAHLEPDFLDCQRDPADPDRALVLYGVRSASDVSPLLVIPLRTSAAHYQDLLDRAFSDGEAPARLLETRVHAVPSAFAWAHHGNLLGVRETSFAWDEGPRRRVRKHYYVYYGESVLLIEEHHKILAVWGTPASFAVLRDDALFRYQLRDVPAEGAYESSVLRDARPMLRTRLRGGGVTGMAPFPFELHGDGDGDGDDDATSLH